jgi:hypothetical protein
LTVEGFNSNTGRLFGTMSTSKNLDLVLDAFGQRLCTIFTQMSFCYALDNSTVPEDILSTLRAGLERLAASFPWLAGQVIVEGAGPGNSGVYKIVPHEATPKFFVNDLQDDPTFPSYQDLRDAGFPMNELPQTKLSPRGTISGTPSERLAEVYQLQANFINGGLILTFTGQHQAMDGIGMDEVIRLYSKTCAGDVFTEEELRIGNHASENTIRTFGDDWQPGPELSNNIITDDGCSRRAAKSAAPGTWALFNFSVAAQRELKSVASESLPSTIPWISTDDALTTFVWQTITRARQHHVEANQELRLVRAVDLRKYLDISPTHPGFVQSMTYHKFTAHSLINEPLGTIVADIRTAMDPAALTLHGRSFATLISRSPDKTTTSYMANHGPDDFMISSWANQRSYEYEFGLGLGKPEAVRLPCFECAPGWMYFMPRKGDGSLGFVVNLAEEDMDKLKGDEVFAKYASFVG